MMIRRLICLLFLISGLHAARAQDETDAGQEPATGSEPATVEIWHREIVTFRATLAGFTPEKRRASTMERIQTLHDFSAYDQLEAVPISVGNLDGIAFNIGDERLFVLIEEDLDPTHDQSFDEATEETLQRLKDLRQAWMDQKSGGVILRGVGLSLVTLVVVIAIFFALNRLAKVIRKFFYRRAVRLSQLKRKDFDMRPVLLQLTRRMVGFVVALVGFTAAFLGITFMFSQFPYTAPWAASLGEQLSVLVHSLIGSFLRALPGVLIVILIFFITRGTAKIVSQLLESLGNSNDESDTMGKDTAKATRRIAGVIVWVAGIVIAYPYIPGSDSAAFKGVSVLLGLMVSLGSSGFINQFMSGFVVLYSGAVRSGEYVHVGGVEGTVTEIGLLSTIVCTPKNEFVSVPNAVLVSKETYNYSRKQTTGEMCEISTSVTIGYDTPWKQVHELLLKAADRTSGIRDNPEPRVLQTALTDFYAEYDLRFVPGDISKKGVILSNLHQRIQDFFHEAGVQIMSPNFVAQPDRPVLPAIEEPPPEDRK